MGSTRSMVTMSPDVWRKLIWENKVNSREKQRWQTGENLTKFASLTPVIAELELQSCPSMVSLIQLGRTLPPSILHQMSWDVVWLDNCSHMSFPEPIICSYGVGFYSVTNTEECGVIFILDDMGHTGGMVDHTHTCENSTLSRREGGIDIWKLQTADIYPSNKRAIYGGILSVIYWFV